MGMTPEQYWDGDPSLARAYREADRISLERKNEQAWLSGLYIYQALCAVSPIFRSFAKKGTKAQPYLDKPLPVTKERAEENTQEEDKRILDKGRRFMEVFALNHNKRMQAQEVKQNGRDD